MCIKIREKIKISLSSKNIIRIISGTMVGQLISFISLPILTRIYGAKIIGIWSIISSITYMIKSFSDLCLSETIMIEENEKVLDIYNVISTMSFFISIIAGIFIFIYYSIFPQRNDISPAIMAIILIINSWVLKQVDTCYAWLNRQKNYKILMKNPMINQLSIFLTSMFFYFIGIKEYGYYIGCLAGSIITLLHMRKFLPKKIFTFKFDLYKYTILKYKKFIKYQMPTSILTQIQNSIPSLLINTLFGSEFVGYYSVSTKLLQAPINLLATSIGRVFFSEVAEMKRDNKEIKYYINRTINNTLKLSVIPLMLLLAFGDISVIILLGKEWIMTGYILQIMAIPAVFIFIIMSTQGIAILLDKQKYILYITIIQIISSLISFKFVGSVTNNIYIVLIVNGVLGLIINIIYFSIFYKVMKLSIRKYMSNIIINLLLIILGAIILRYIFVHLIIDNIIY